MITRVDKIANFSSATAGRHFRNLSWLADRGRQPLFWVIDKFSGRQTPRLASPFLFLFLSWYFCLSLLLSSTHRHTPTWSVCGVLTDSRSHTSSSRRACVPVYVWRALTDSVWVCDRGCQRSVREMCLVSHSADLISGRTVHSGPAVAPYITPAVIHTPAWRDPPLFCAQTLADTVI